MSRPAGRPNLKPGKEAVRGYYRLLREAADEGDVNAARHLIELHEISRHKAIIIPGDGAALLRMGFESKPKEEH